ncbi:MAG TPA: MIP/aquaporin family protein [Caulifigura sp.]|jgi:glycerol uptake facilitator protein|nr:MIP/aquaporin family protein [Caulifigura sp.]
MTPFTAELIGTAFLVLLGDGVVANVVLGKTKGNSSGWIVITAGWAFAVTIGVYIANSVTGGHLNPAVSISQAVLGKITWDVAATYIAAQMIGAFIGAVLVWLSYLPHWAETPEPGAKLAVFCTGPAVRNYGANLITEIVGTFVLVFALAFLISKPNLTDGTGFDKAIQPMLVGLVVWAIGVSLGGPTGYAINPARDLGPRIAHAVLPIPGKVGSDWAYAWVPVVGPIIGAILGGFAAKAVLG